MSTYGIIASLVLLYEIGVLCGVYLWKWRTNSRKRWMEHKVYYSVDIDGFDPNVESIEEFIERRLDSGVGKIELK